MTGQITLLVSALMLLVGLYLLGARWYLFAVAVLYLGLAWYGRGIFGA